MRLIARWCVCGRFGERPLAGAAWCACRPPSGAGGAAGALSLFACLVPARQGRAAARARPRRGLCAHWTRAARSRLCHSRGRSPRDPGVCGQAVLVPARARRALGALCVLDRAACRRVGAGDGLGHGPGERLRAGRFVRAHRKSVQRWLDDLQVAGLVAHEPERDRSGRWWRTQIVLLAAPHPTAEELRIATQRAGGWRARELACVCLVRRVAPSAASTARLSRKSRASWPRLGPWDDDARAGTRSSPCRDGISIAGVNQRSASHRSKAVRIPDTCATASRGCGTRCWPSEGHFRGRFDCPVA